ncbi:M20 family peptidase, partial [Rhizobium ruizarguesonis]
AAKKCGLPLYYDPMLLLCTYEEGGLYPGIRYLAEQVMLKGHILNFNGSAAPRIWARCFGFFHLQVTIRGRAVHSGEGNRTGAGINAIEGA